MSEADLRGRRPERWPSFAPAALREDVGAVFAFPMLVGRLVLGAVDLYSARPRPLTEGESKNTMALVEVVSRHVLRRSLEDIDAGTSAVPDTDRYSRRLVHQATGMVIAQLGVSPEEAELVLRGHAFAEERSMREVADDVLEGRLRFRFDAGGIQEQP